MTNRLTALLLASLSSGAVLAQAGAAGAPQDLASLTASMEAAQAAASRPGDEALSCDDMQAQVVAVVQDPRLTAHVEAAGTAAQAHLDALDAAGSLAAAQTAQAIIASILPGGAMAMMGPYMAQGQANQALASQRVQSIMGQGMELMTLMPGLMRGHALIQLAAAKGCDWAMIAKPAGDAPPPAATGSRR